MRNFLLLLLKSLFRKRRSITTYVFKIEQMLPEMQCIFCMVIVCFFVPISAACEHFSLQIVNFGFGLILFIILLMLKKTLIKVRTQCHVDLIK